MSEHHPTDGLTAPLAVALSGCLAVAAVAILPVIRLDAPWADLSLYWSTGLGGLWVVLALSSLLTVVALAASTGRIDPATGLGIAFGLGLVLAVATLLWAVSVDRALVDVLSPAAWFAYHRWLLAAVAAVPAAAVGWGAVRVDLL